MSVKGEILNEAEVDFLLAAAAAGSEEASSQSADVFGEGQTVTMRGDLEQINLADIFQTLAMSKMEGVLRVHNPLEDRQIYCNDGTVRIQVPPRVAVRRLGQRLVQAGLIDGEQLRSVLMIQRKERLPIGAVLVREGLVTQDQIDGIAGMQIAEDLFALFTWRHGTFEFYKGGLADDAQRQRFEACPEFEVNSLLLEVARRSDEWQSILDAISSLEEVPHRIADPTNEAELGEAHRAMLFGADGNATYRALAEQTTLGLFEVARAARDLVRRNLLANISDEDLVQVATSLTDASQNKKALILLQTLRDRPGARSLLVVQAMAGALEKAGERRLAGTTLLEAAKQQIDPLVALRLARRSRDLAPNDPATIRFLRTTLVVHAPQNSPELEKCTVDLLDALIEADLTATALEIVEDARATGTIRPQILVREARARQKARDTQGAANVLFELAGLYEAEKDLPRAIEAYESVLRLDRSRKDVQKLLAELRKTRLGRIVRATAFVLATLLLGGMGLVFWQQHSLDQAIHQADEEISKLLQVGDQEAAAARLEHWLATLGPCEAVEDFQSRIAFAEVAERGSRERVLRDRVNGELRNAASMLGRGELRSAFATYAGLWREPPVQAEVSDVVATRFEVLLKAIEHATKSMAHHLPPEPNSLIERHELTNHLHDLESFCPPTLLRVFEELDQMAGENTLPEFLSTSHRERVAAVLPIGRVVFAGAKRLIAVYREALQWNEQQRQLDPLFKAAVQKESTSDFTGALELYRRLESAQSGSNDLRAYFQKQIARNEEICRLMNTVAAATAAGDFPRAQQQYRALRLAFPGVPFERLVRLPLRLESVPDKAAITCNDKNVGRTPLLLSYFPADVNTIVAKLDGFMDVRTTITGDELGLWRANLLLEAPLWRKHDSMVEVAPAIDETGALFLVDRAGAVTAIRADGSEAWKYQSRDLSGYLSQPLIFGPHVMVASLDGELRAIDRSKGEVIWHLSGLPTEARPVLVDRFLVVATTDRSLHAIDLVDRRRVHIALPEASHGRLLAQGSTIVAVGERGTVTAHALPSLTLLWQRPIGRTIEAMATISGNRILVSDDRGKVRCLDLTTGDLLWHRNLDTETMGQPICVGHVVWIASPERLLRLDLQTGEDLAPIASFGEDGAGGPIRVGDRLLLPIRDGNLQVLDLTTGNSLYRIEGNKRGRTLVVGESVFIVLEDRSIRRVGALR
ncbi:MAG: PQQ-binding-like beta-propeller repeat protein [Planctomycetota bacterium]